MDKDEKFLDELMERVRKDLKRIKELDTDQYELTIRTFEMLGLKLPSID